jgi:hypothetical protein
MAKIKRGKVWKGGRVYLTASEMAWVWGWCQGALDSSDYRQTPEESAAVDAVLLRLRDKIEAACVPAPTTATPLCYPFGTGTCDKPGCNCRAEKAAAPTTDTKGGEA